MTTRRWLGSLWVDAKVALRSQAADPDSELRARLTDAIVAAGHRLEGDPVLAGKVDDVVEWGIRYVGEHFRSEIAGLVSGTLARWDAEETSRKLELLLALICSSSASTAPSSAASSASPSTSSAT